MDGGYIGHLLIWMLVLFLFVGRLPRESMFRPRRFLPPAFRMLVIGPVRRAARFLHWAAHPIVVGIHRMCRLGHALWVILLETLSGGLIVGFLGWFAGMHLADETHENYILMGAVIGVLFGLVVGVINHVWARRTVDEELPEENP